MTKAIRSAPERETHGKVKIADAELDSTFGMQPKEEIIMRVKYAGLGKQGEKTLTKKLVIEIARFNRALNPAHGRQALQEGKTIGTEIFHYRKA